MSPSVLAGRSLYLCTPDRDDLARFIGACCAGGVDVVQLREKQLEARPLLARARLALGVCRDLGVPFILNDRPDLALECGADGVHVGQDDVPASLCRRLLGEQAVIGLSTHASAELAAARHEPVDYLSVGPISPTPTKPGRPGTGLGYVEEAAVLLGDPAGAPHARRAGGTGTSSGAVRSAAMPFFVTGGVAPETIPAIAAAGARRFVVVRYLTEAADPRSAAVRLRRAIDAALAQQD